MKLIQILLPLRDNDDVPFEKHVFTEIRDVLVNKFGGLTEYTRSPATGLWKESDPRVVKDEIIVYEIMVKEIEPDWWMKYKKKLLAQFRQNEIVIRSIEIALL